MTCHPFHHILGAKSWVQVSLWGTCRFGDCDDHHESRLKLEKPQVSLLKGHQELVQPKEMEHGTSGQIPKPSPDGLPDQVK